MTKVPIKGEIVDNDTATVYDWLGYDAVSPKKVEGILNDADDNEVEVDVASGGGDVFAASEIYTMLKNFNGKVVVNIQGLAASAASVISMAGDVVNMSPTAQMMIHKAWTISMGNADDLDHDSKMMDVTDQSIVNAYEAKTGLDRDEILKMMSDETWMTAQDAVDKGFADAISTGSNDKKPVQMMNGVTQPLLNHEAVNKIKNLMAKARQAKPENVVETPQDDKEPTPSLKERKLDILFGKDDEGNEN